jgi:hypothetical protein
LNYIAKSKLELLKGFLKLRKGMEKYRKLKVIGKGSFGYAVLV